MHRLPTLLCALALAFALAGQAGAQESFRFIQVTDTHLTATANVAPLKQLVADLNSMTPKPAFVVDTGDVTESGTQEQYGRFTDAIAGLTVPFYCAPGNHDVRWAPLGKEAFTNNFKKLNQSFDYGGCHFVILDSTVLLEHWGHFDGAELKWLEADLKKTKKDQPIFLFFHHWIGRDPQMVDNQEALLRIIAPYNVAAMLVGHGHADIQWKVNGIQCVMARGLYQGSYNIVDVGPSEIRILRWRKERGNGPPAVIATIPRDPGPRKQVAFLWDDPDIPLLARRRPLAELRIGKQGAHDPKVTAAYSVDGGPQQPMARDERDKESVSFRAQFETKDLGNGAHRLRVFLTDGDGEVYEREEPFVVERLEGQPKRKWDDPFRTDDTIESSPTLAGDTLYVTSFDGKLYALDARTGKRRWAASTKGAIYATPVVDGGTVYVGSMDHNFYAFDAGSGRPRWKFDAETPLFATAAVSNGTVCFGANKKIFGLDAATGKPRWTADAGGLFQSRAAAADGVFYLGGWDNTLYALDAASGQVKWTERMGRTNGGRGDISFYYSPAIASPSVGGGHVFVCTDDGVLHAVNTANGHDDWIARAPMGGDTFGYSSPLFVDGRVYVGGLGKNGDCYAFDAKTGDLLWRCSTGAENYDSSPRLAGGRVVIGSVQGKLSWIDAATGALKYQYALDPGWCFSSPALAPNGGKMAWMTSMNGQVYALSVP